VWPCLAAALSGFLPRVSGGSGGGAPAACPCGAGLPGCVSGLPGPRVFARLLAGCSMAFPVSLLRAASGGRFPVPRLVLPFLYCLPPHDMAARCAFRRFSAMPGAASGGAFRPNISVCRFSFRREVAFGS